MREANEDGFLARPERGLAIVADGMGGHLAGDVASQVALRIIERALCDAPPQRGWLRRWLDRVRRRELGPWPLVRAVEAANEAVREEAFERPERKGMGTTIVALWLHGTVVHLAHVGDSRIYRMREGEIEQLTQDHSLWNKYLRIGLVTPEDEEEFPHKHVIVRGVGLSHDVLVDTRTLEVEAGDVFLLCSDGLTDLVETPTIRDALRETGTLEPVAERLVALALEAGGVDNVTAVVGRIDTEGQ